MAKQRQGGRGILGPESRSVREVVIGEYTKSNQTVWFKLNESRHASTYDVDIYYFDEEARDAYWEEQYSNLDMVDAFLFAEGRSWPIVTPMRPS